MAPAVGGPVGYTPPEGVWGWMVLSGAFISIGFSYAFAKSITVFFKEIEAIFNVSSSQVSWISSIMLACMYGGGKFKDIYHDYKYTYQGWGILLIVSSVFLFLGMGLNYRLLDKERKEEERKGRMGVREQKSNRGNNASFHFQRQTVNV